MDVAKCSVFCTDTQVMSRHKAQAQVRCLDPPWGVALQNAEAAGSVSNNMAGTTASLDSRPSIQRHVQSRWILLSFREDFSFANFEVPRNLRKYNVLEIIQAKGTASYMT